MSIELRKKIIAEVDALKDEIIEYAVKLIRTKSDNPPGLYAEISKVVAEKFRDLGFDEIKVIQIPDELIKKVGLETPRINVLGIMKGTIGKPTLALQPHLDAVPPGGGWTVDPYGGEIRDGWIYGRGSSDCKGDIAAYTYALTALKNAGVKLKGNAVVVGSVDEETGGHLGPEYLLDEGIIQADMVIAEGYTHHIWNAANGCMWMKVTTTGKAAHAMHPQLGIDAIRKMHKVLSALYDYQYRLLKRRSEVNGIEYPTIVPSIIHAGVKENVVCDKCEMRFDRRITPEEKGEEVEEEIIEMLKGLMSEDPEMKIDWERLILAKSSGPISIDHPLIQSLKKAGREVLDEDLPVTGIPGFTDARFYWEREIPIAHYGTGPKVIGEGRPHGPDERLPIKDLIDGTKVLALSVMDLLNRKLESIGGILGEKSFLRHLKS